jgi:cellulose biosynthesis protein BcsQ
MNTSWNQPTPHSGGETPVSLLIAHRDMNQTTAWYQAIQVDARFRVSSMANSAQDLQSKLASSPEVILLDATLFEGPSQLVQALTSISGAVYLIVPGGTPGEVVESLKTIASVKQLYLGDAPIADFMTRAHNDALALRRTVPSLNPSAWAGGRNPSAVTGGLRTITVWSRSGGVGRSTIAAGLAQAIARRGMKTLLIGLGAPDVIPLHLGLQPDPNILTWLGNPSDDGLRAGLQKLGDLDVLAGFPDIVSESSGEKPASEKGSITELVTSAAYSGYAAIVLDTPVSGVAPHAISAANTWLLVARPTVADAWAAVDAYRTVTQRAAGTHRITPGNIFVVLNQRANGMLTADQWHAAADSACRKIGLNIGFPPVLAVIPYLPDLSIAQDSGRSVLDSSDEFARPLHRMADGLFGGGQQSVQSKPRDEEGTFRIGPLKIKTR